MTDFKIGDKVFLNNDPKEIGEIIKVISYDIKLSNGWTKECYPSEITKIEIKEQSR